RLEQGVDNAEGHVVAVPLVRPRRVGEAVANYPAARRQGRAYRAIEMIGARGIVQERLGDRRPAIGIARDQKLADALCTRSAAGLAGLDDIDATLPQPACEQLDLRRLAGALPAFQRNEFSAGAIHHDAIRRSQPCGETRYFSVAMMWPIKPT